MLYNTATVVTPTIGVAILHIGLRPPCRPVNLIADDLVGGNGSKLSSALGSGIEDDEAVD
jgi:hypothetical protein